MSRSKKAFFGQVSNSCAATIQTKYVTSGDEKRTYPKDKIEEEKQTFYHQHAASSNSHLAFLFLATVASQQIVTPAFARGFGSTTTLFVFAVPRTRARK